MTNPLDNNSYRILGLDVTASQKEVLRRSKEIINRLKIDDYPKFDIDIKLPDKYRTEASVKDALRELQAQKSSINQYFFWFRIEDKNDLEALENIKEGSFTKALKVWKTVSKDNEKPVAFFYKKNLALLYCLLLDEESEGYLNHSLSIWKGLLNSEKFWMVFLKSYGQNTEQAASEEIIPSLKTSIIKELSDVYTDLGKTQKNPGYTKAFQEIFATYGEKTEKDLLNPVYKSIYDKLEELKKIKIEEEWKAEPDVCQNCSTKKSDSFWEYEDGSILCDKCHDKMGKQWEKTVKERLKDIDVNSDDFKWLRPDLKVAIVVKAIETDFSELRKSGLYDVSQSRRVRDHVAIEIREKAMLLHNNAGLFDESAKMAKIASDIAGTESYKTQLQNEESQIQNTVKINDTGMLTLQVSGFLRTKLAEFRLRYFDYEGKRIYYKDIDQISLSAVRSNYSTTYTFQISCSGERTSFTVSSLETWNKLQGIAFQWIIPSIVKKCVDRIFDKKETVDIGELSFSKKGYSRSKLFGGIDSVSWSEKNYTPQFRSGSVTLWKEREGKPTHFSTIPLTTDNAIIIPELTKACLQRVYILGTPLYKEVQNNVVPKSSSEIKPENKPDNGPKPTYYIIKNKNTSLWDICTNSQDNPPLEKHRWAVDFDTKEEAEKYLKETLEKIKNERG